MIRALLLALVLLMAAALPAAASGNDEYFPEYSGDQFQAIYDHAAETTLANLDPPGGQVSITGNADVDARIWRIAFDRGYLLRPVANGGLVSVDGVQMQPEAAAAWKQLRAEARAAGYRFIVSSAYRSPNTQRTWFNTKLSGTSDDAINTALTWYSIPGTSKHHSGYALDFRHRNETFGSFRDTPDYAWLAANNFSIPKTYGFIPSYPDDGSAQGPSPEPWEFVWVGVDAIRCGVPMDVSESRFAMAHRSWLADDVVACSGGVTLDELDEMIRTLGPKLGALLRA